MKKDKDFIFWAIGYGILVSYWVLGSLFCLAMLIYHWNSYITVGETVNHLSLFGLIFCTAAVPIALIASGFGVYWYIHQIKMYNNREVK